MECFPKVLWIALRFCLSKEPPLCMEGAEWLLAVQCEYVSKVGERGRERGERERVVGSLQGETLLLEKRNEVTLHGS